MDEPVSESILYAVEGEYKSQNPLNAVRIGGLISKQEGESQDLCQRNPSSHPRPQPAEKPRGMALKPPKKVSQTTPFGGIFTGPYILVVNTMSTEMKVLVLGMPRTGTQCKIISIG
jgi:hypothetical protein